MKRQSTLGVRQKSRRGLEHGFGGDRSEGWAGFSVRCGRNSGLRLRFQGCVRGENRWSGNGGTGRGRQVLRLDSGARVGNGASDGDSRLGFDDQWMVTRDRWLGLGKGLRSLVMVMVRGTYV